MRRTRKAGGVTSVQTPPEQVIPEPEGMALACAAPGEFPALRIGPMVVWPPAWIACFVMFNPRLNLVGSVRNELIAPAATIIPDSEKRPAAISM